MTTETVLREDSLNSVRTMRQVYRVASQYTTVTGRWGIPPLPTFDELFEEFVMFVLEERTDLSKGQIDQELKALKESGMVDVEKGFRSEELGVDLKLEFYATLHSMQLVFMHKAEVINLPIQEVW